MEEIWEEGRMVVVSQLRGLFGRPADDGRTPSFVCATFISYSLRLLALWTTRMMRREGLRETVRLGSKVRQE
jgi:hypothetical protein